MAEEMEMVAEVVHEAEFVETAPEETFEEREARLKREAYARNNLQAIAEREEILRRNGVLKEDEPFSMDPDAAVDQWCCN